MEYISSSCPSCGIHFSDISFFITFCVFSLFFSGYRCVVLDSGVFHLLSEVGPGVYAGLLVGGTDACPVELSWVLSSGVSMGVFRNICFFRMTLGSFPDENCSYLFTLLIIWPEVSQHRKLQAVRYAQVLGAKMTNSRRAHTDEYSLRHLPPGFFPPQWATFNLHLPKRTTKITGRSGTVSYGITALPWVPVHVKSCVWSLRVESLFPWSFAAPSLPVHIQSQII